MSYFGIDGRLYLGALIYEPAAIEDWQQNLLKDDGRVNHGK